MSSNERVKYFTKRVKLTGGARGEPREHGVVVVMKGGSAAVRTVDDAKAEMVRRFIAQKIIAQKKFAVEGFGAGRTRYPKAGRGWLRTKAVVEVPTLARKSSASKALLEPLDYDELISRLSGRRA